MAAAEGLSRRVAATGGAALIIDYGQDGPYEASLQISTQIILLLAYVPGV